MVARTSRFETQNAAVLAHLKSGKTLTPLEALEQFGSLRLAARVYDLRERGWPIHCDIVYAGEGRYVGQYSLHMDKALWPDAENGTW